MSGEKGEVGKILYKLFETNNFSISSLDFNDLTNKEVFIHLAARTENTNNLIYSNIDFLRECISYCRKINIKYFIFFSSVSIYGNINCENINESSDFNNHIGTYGLTKLLGENLLKDEEFKVVILRLPAILTQSNQNIMLRKIYNKLLNNETITITNGNKLYNNLINVESIFNFILSYDFKKYFDIYLLASKQDKSLNDIIKYLKENLKSESKIINSSRISSFFNIDTTKARINSNYIENKTIKLLDNWLFLINKGRT